MSQLQRDGGALRLPCDGLRVSQVRVDYAFGLELAEDQERATDRPSRIRINTEFTYWFGDTHVQVDPAGPAPSVAPALAVRHETLERGRIYRDGRLVLQFANGSVLEVPAHGQYEAWEATGGEEADRMFIVSPIAPDTYW